MGRLRRVIRITGAIAGIALLFLVGAVGGLLAFLHSDDGRELIRSEAQAQLDELTHGEATIGRIEGSVLGSFTVRDVVLHDADGRVAIAIDRLAVDYHPLALLERRFHADRIGIAGLALNARRDASGAWNLATMWAPTEEGPPWTVQLDEIEIERGVATARGPELELVTARDLSATGELSLTPAALTATVDRLATHWVERGIDVAIIRARWLGDRARVASASASLGSSSVVVESARFDPDTVAGTGEISVEVHPADVRDYAPELRGVVTVHGRVRYADGAAHAALSGTAAGAPFDITASLAPEAPSAELTVTARQLDPSALVAGAPAGSVDLTARGHAGGGTELTRATGALSAQLSGSLAGIDAESVQVDADLDRGGALTARLAASTAHGILDGTARAELGGDRIELSGELSAQQLRYGELRGRRASASFHATGLPDRPRGQLTFSATGLRRGADTIGSARGDLAIERGGDRVRGELRVGRSASDLWARLRGDAIRRGQRWSIDLDRLVIGYRDQTWRGDARATAGPRRIEVDRFALSSTTAELSATGWLRPDGSRGQLSLSVDDADLRRISELTPGAPADLRGNASLNAELTRERRWAVDAELEVTHLAWRGSGPPLDARAEVDLGDRQLAFDVEIDAGRGGRVALTGAVQAPRQQLEPAAWLARGHRDIERLELSLRRVDLERLARRLPEPPELEGMVDGDIIVHHQLDRFDVDLLIRDLRDANLRRPVAVDLSGRGNAETIRGRLDVTSGRLNLSGRLELRTGVGALWQHPERITSTPIEGRLELAELPLTDAAAMAGIELPAVDGTVRARAEISGTIDEPRGDARARIASLSVNDRRFGRITARAIVDPDGWRARARTRQPQGGRMELRARGPLDGPPTRARLEVDQLRLGFLGPVLRERRLAAGEVRGLVDARARYRRGQEPSGWIRLSGGEIQPTSSLRRLSNARLTASLTDGALSFEAAADSGPGEVSVAGFGRIEELELEKLSARLVANRLPIVTGGAKVALDLDSQLFGEQRGQTLALDAVVRTGTLHLPKRIDREQLHDTGPLPDVVYADERDRLADEDLAPWLRLSVTTPNLFRVRGDGDLDARFDVDLDVTILGSTPMVSGRIEAERGKIDLFDRSYRITRGTMTFRGRSPIDPKLTIELAHDFDRMTLFIEVRGTVDEPEIDLRSSPAAYSRGELLGFVLGGDPDGAGGRAAPAGAAAALIAGQVESALERRIPIDTVRLGTSADDDEQLSYVTVGKWLSEDLFVAYERQFSADENENANEAKLEYHFLRRWEVEARVGDRGAGSVDLLWTKRF